MDIPKVSICIPAYNNAAEVKRLLESIRMQTFRDLEIILTDDSTNEEIAELVKSSGWEDIRYIHNEKPLGHIFNWNKSLSEAQGEYIKIMFSDDWFTAPDSLEKMVSLLDRAPEASLAFCGTMQVMLPEGGQAAKGEPEGGSGRPVKKLTPGRRRIGTRTGWRRITGTCFWEMKSALPARPFTGPAGQCLMRRATGPPICFCTLKYSAGIPVSSVRRSL